MSSANTLKRVSGEAYFRAAGSVEWLTLGDVMMHQLQYDVSAREVLRPTRHGIVTRAAEHVTRMSLAWRLDLQQEIAPLIAARLFAAPATEVTHDPVEDLETNLENVVAGPWYDVGARMLSNADAFAGDTLLTVGVDFDVDRVLGLIRFSADHEEVTVLVDAPATSGSECVSGTSPQRTGRFRLVEWDGHTASSRCEYQFDCSLRVESTSEDSPTAFSSMRFRVAAIGPVTELRPEPAYHLPSESLILLTESGTDIETEAGVSIIA